MSLQTSVLACKHIHLHTGTPHTCEHTYRRAYHTPIYVQRERERKILQPAIKHDRVVTYSGGSDGTGDQLEEE